MRRTLMGMALSWALIGPLGYLLPKQVQAQAPLKLEDLRTPSSPAFVLLGVEPAAAERPSTPKALAASFISATTSGDLLPRNYALEIAPYWLASHPRLTFEDYYHARLGQNLIQTLSLSLVTSKDTTALDTLTAGTRVGLGVRALLVAGHANPALAEQRAKLRELQDSVLLTEAPDVEDSLTTKRIRPIALAMQALDKERVGWRVEVAAAVAATFRGDNFGDGKVTRVGVWVTPSYRPVGDSLDFIAVGRFIRTLEDSADALLDLGARIRWQKGKLLLSSEFVHRARIGGSINDDGSERLVGSLEYRVNDQITLSTTFGKNYDQGSTGHKTLITQFGIDFGFGGPPLLCLVKKCE